VVQTPAFGIPISMQLSRTMASRILVKRAKKMMNGEAQIAEYSCFYLSLSPLYNVHIPFNRFLLGNAPII
jgi:hypothetical protein